MTFDENKGIGLLSGSLIAFGVYKLLFSKSDKKSKNVNDNFHSTFKGLPGTITVEVLHHIYNIIAQWESARNYAAIKATPKEFSYGLLQANYQSGSLSDLIYEYDEAHGKYSTALSKYFEGYDDEKSHTDIWKDAKLQRMLKEAATDKKMRDTQDLYFFNDFLKPAFEYAKEQNYHFPVSYLVIGDSYINQGEDATRERLKKWAKGKTELDKIHSYVANRKAYLLRTMPSEVDLQNRQNFLLHLIATDPNLSKQAKVRNTLV